MDSLYRDRFDVFIGIDAKVNPRDGGGHRTCEIRHGSLQLLARQMSCARLFLFFFLELLESKKKKKKIYLESLRKNRPQELFSAVRHRLQSISGQRPVISTSACPAPLSRLSPVCAQTLFWHCFDLVRFFLGSPSVTPDLSVSAALWRTCQATC